MPVKRAGRKAARKRAPLRRKVAPTSKKAINKIVKSTVGAMIETKEVRNSNANASLYSYPFSPTLPSNYALNNIIDTSTTYQGIQQGTGEGNRLANLVIPTRFTYSFCLTARAGVNSPLMARMFVVSYKFDLNNSTTNDIWSSLQQVNNNNFFDNGNTSSGMSGTLTDLLLPINTDAYRVYKVKTYKLAPSGLPTGTGGGNNDFKYMIKKSINLLPYIQKKLRWNDTSSTSFNKKVFIIWEILAADGTTITDGSPIATISYSFNFKYKDA